MIAHVVGISPALGPILGVVPRCSIAGDPRGIIWPKAQQPTPTGPDPEHEPGLTRRAPRAATTYRRTPGQAPGVAFPGMSAQESSGGSPGR